jgi:hypothetical protein
MSFGFNFRSVDGKNVTAIQTIIGVDIIGLTILSFPDAYLFAFANWA